MQKFKFITSVVTPIGEFEGPEFEAKSWEEARNMAKESYVIIIGTSQK